MTTLFSRQEWTRLGVMFAVIAALHVIGWGTSVFLVIGTSVSGAFLYLIAAINIVILAGILRVFAAMRRDEYNEAALEQHLANRCWPDRAPARGCRGTRSCACR